MNIGISFCGAASVGECNRKNWFFQALAFRQSEGDVTLTHDDLTDYTRQDI